MPLPNSEQLSWLLTSGAVIAVIAYVFRLSGAIAADSKAYLDDRSAVERLIGPVAALGLISGPTIIVAWAFGKVVFWSRDFMFAILIGFIQAALLMLSEYYTQEKSRIRSPLIDAVSKAAVDAEARATESGNNGNNGANRFREWLGGPLRRIIDFVTRHHEPLARYFLVPALVTAALYLVVLEWAGGNVVWGLYFSLQFFVCFIIAMGVSTVFLTKRSRIDIYFKDTNSAPLTDVVLLKTTDSVIRVVHDGAVHVLSRDTISRFVERLSPKRYMGEIERERENPLSTQK